MGGQNILWLITLFQISYRVICLSKMAATTLSYNLVWFI